MQENSKEQQKPRFYYGWVIVAVVALAGFTRSAETYPVIGVFLKPMTEEFGWSRSVFSGATSVGTILGGVMALGVGPLVDRYGPRWMLTVGFAVLGATMILLAAIDSLWEFYVLEVIGRMMAMGLIGMAIQVIIPKWFVAKRGRTVAISGLGQRLGNMVTPLYVQFLVTYWNWRIATATTGIVIWALSLLPVALFLRRRPEDMGLLPDGVTQEELKKQEETRIAEGKQAVQEISLSLRQVARLPSFYLLTASFSLSFVALPGLNLHLIPYMTDQGLSEGIAVTIVSLISGSGAVGSILFGVLTERYGSRLVLTLNFVLTAFGFVLLLFVHSTVAALLWGFYHGLLWGGVITLQQIVFANYYGRDSLGAIRGVVWPVQMVANAIGPFVAGLVYDLTGSYFSIFVAFGVILFLSGVLSFLAHPPKNLTLDAPEVAA